MTELPPDSSGELLRARLEAVADPGGLLALIFANAPMGLQLYARDGRCVLVNSAHTELFGGVPPPGYNIFEDTILEARGMTGLVRRAFAGERIAIPPIWYDIRELRNLPPTTDVSGGRRIAISAEMVPLRDAAGEVTHVLIVFHDMTIAEQRAAQSAFLAEASRLLSASLDFETTLAQVARLATPELADFCIVDLLEDGPIRRLAAVHADPSQQSILDELRERFPPTPESPQPAARVIRTGKPELITEVDETQISSHTIDPDHFSLMSRLGVRSHLAVPLQIGERTVGAISFGYSGPRRYQPEDVPLFEALANRAAVAIENARLYRAAEAARVEAEAASRAKDEFLAMLGHELRNPLAPIVTALELSQGQSKELDVIRRQVGHLRRLVDDLLDVARITRGTLEIELASIELADATADGVEAARPLIDQRGQELHVDVPAGLVVRGDRARLAQVIANLLTNAARYTDRGGRIDVSARRADGEIVFVVRDTGIGMPADLVSRVFHIFTRGERAADRASGGLGLGLAIVKSITELHGGRVAARSEGTGRGSEFELVLPALDTHEPALAQSPKAVPKANRAARVLVVDDNIDAAMLLAEGLELAGFTPLVAHDADDALERARREAPELAVVDIGLPGTDGYELGASLHALPGLARMPIVALTGYGQAADRTRSERAGFRGHFVKPVQLEALVIALHRLLGT